MENGAFIQHEQKWGQYMFDVPTYKEMQVPTPLLEMEVDYRKALKEIPVQVKLVHLNYTTGETMTNNLSTNALQLYLYCKKAFKKSLKFKSVNGLKCIKGGILGDKVDGVTTKIYTNY